MLKLTKVVTRILKRRKKDGVVSFFFFFFALFFHVMYFCAPKKKTTIPFPPFICMHASVCVYGALYSVCIVCT